MYSAVTFPQAGSSGYSFDTNVAAGIVSYANVAPSTATSAGALIPAMWNPFSATAAYRTQYWVDTAGTLTLAEAQLACFGLAGVQDQQITVLTNSWNSEKTTVPVTIEGTRYILDDSPSHQAQNVSYGVIAQGMLATATPWTSGTVVSTGSICSISGTVLYCSTGGTTASGSVTAPTTFGTPVTDGTAVWELAGRRVYLTSGTYLWMAPQNLLSSFEQGEQYLHDINDRYYNLVSEVKAATTVQAIQSVIW
jgi:hypothetical protein